MSEGHTDRPVFTSDQRRAAFAAPLFVLGFLTERSQRQLIRDANNFASLSDSAVFHRLYDLAWTPNEPQVIVLLTADEQAALTEFSEAFRKLQWRPLEEHPHICELPDDDLSPLLPAGSRLYRLLESRNLVSD